MACVGTPVHMLRVPALGHGTHGNAQPSGVTRMEHTWELCTHICQHWDMVDMEASMPMSMWQWWGMVDMKASIPMIM